MRENTSWIPRPGSSPADRGPGSRGPSAGELIGALGPAFVLRGDGESREGVPDQEVDAIDHAQALRCELVCAACRRPVSEVAARFVMAGDSPFCVFANPHGRVFEIQTLTWAAGLTLIEPPTTDFSWFAGYAWRVAVCNRCLAHLGWRFDASTGNASPEVFWGLLRSAVLEQ